MKNVSDNIDVVDIDNAIQMLNKYAKEASLKPLISILEELKQDRHSDHFWHN